MLLTLTACLTLAVRLPGQVQHAASGKVLPEAGLAKKYFGNDAPWFAENIPFFEIDDANIERVYYYRWKLYRAHMRDIGEQGTDETEFLPDVPWARKPYTDLNDSSSFHILEGRWLRNPAYVSSLVDHLYAGGGNDRHFSESIAAATYAWTQVTGDAQPAIRHLDTMEHIYNLWDDHFDHTRNLYWIEPLTDATEYSIASIDASGAGFTDKPLARDSQNGFTGGYSFRPSINAYQFANARAIANLARISGNSELAGRFDRRAEALRKATLGLLWNPDLLAFTDMYQRSTQFVEAGKFIRGRELVQYVPWMYGLPTHGTLSQADKAYDSAWTHVLKSDELAGKYGLRTAEPSYPRYMRQYRFDASTGLRECQWNGPSWPFQTSQTLTAMAALLHDHNQTVVSKADYVHLLQQYTQQHQLPDGTLDLQEDYDPDTGKVIVGLPRSHHYNHSTYIDLVISGFLGIQPRSDDVLEIDPLLPAASTSEASFKYFALQGLRYHGHELTVLYDALGTRYHLGRGLSIFSDGRRIAGPQPIGHLVLPLKRITMKASTAEPQDVAVNVWEQRPPSSDTDLPIAFGSPATDDAHLYEAIDGRTWYFPEIANGWSPAPEPPSGAEPVHPVTFSVDLRHPHVITEAQLFFFADGTAFSVPVKVRLEYMLDGTWRPVPGQREAPAAPIGNGTNSIMIPPTQGQQFRVVLTPPAKGRIRLIELKLLQLQLDGHSL